MGRQPLRSSSKSPFASRLPGVRWTGRGGSLGAGAVAVVGGDVVAVAPGVLGDLPVSSDTIDCESSPRVTVTATATPAASTSARPPAYSHRRLRTARPCRRGARCRGGESDTAAQSNHISRAVAFPAPPRRWGSRAPTATAGALPLRAADFAGDAAKHAVDEAAGVLGGDRLGQQVGLVQQLQRALPGRAARAEAWQLRAEILVHGAAAGRPVVRPPGPHWTRVR